MTVPQPGIFAQGTRTHHHLELDVRDGVYFLAFSADPSRFRRMLERMFGTTPDGLHDALTAFSEPQSAGHLLRPEPRRPERPVVRVASTRGDPG